MLWEFARTLHISPNDIASMKYWQFCRLEEQIWQTAIKAKSTDEG